MHNSLELLNNLFKISFIIFSFALLGLHMDSAMTFNDFMQRLLSLKEKLLSMPEELTLTEAFQEEQDKLAKLLDNLLGFSADEQTIAREQMRIFADQLNEKLLQLQDRYETLRKNMDDSQLRLKGVKAYAKGRMI